MPPISYNYNQITRWLDARTIVKARGYLKNASNLCWDGDTILTGKVQGTLQIPYKVSIDFEKKRDTLKMEGWCTCPVEYNCKHVGAVLLTNLRQPVASLGMRSGLISWIEEFHSKRLTIPLSKERPSISKTMNALAYVIVKGLGGIPRLQIHKARRNAENKIIGLEKLWNHIEGAVIHPPKFIDIQDLEIMRTLCLGKHENFNANGFELSGVTGGMVIRLVLGTQRVFGAANPGKIDIKKMCELRLGSTRPGIICWEGEINSGKIHPIFCAEPSATMLLMTEPAWYVDTERGEAGIVTLPCPMEQLAHYLSMPPLLSEEIPLIHAVLQDGVSHLPPPPIIQNRPPIRTVDVAPIAMLTLDTLPSEKSSWTHPPAAFDLATAHFDYERFRFDVRNNNTFIRTPENELVYVRRRFDVEQDYLKELHESGMRVRFERKFRGDQLLPEGMYLLEKQNTWEKFLKEKVPVLREKGWQVTMTERCRFNVIEVEEIFGNLSQGDDGWFDVEMGIRVNERTVRLAPLLVGLFEQDPRWLSDCLDKISDDEEILLETENKERLRLRASVLKPVVCVLVDLFNLAKDGPLRISAWDVIRLEELNRTGRWQFDGDASVRRMVQQIIAGPGVRNIRLPRTLRATLRPYQRQGVNWMQFLRGHNLSGVLADDMGLGKTIQALTHILIEKEQGRLDRPALVVVPTTLIDNWHEEARRFTPNLTVMDLHGPERRSRFDQITQYDIVLTTYALLWRDHEVLTRQSYHFLILDEAQYVKNAATQASKVIRKLQARHRLCLTGTPLENHLGELWAQFDFLLPGFLGSHKTFTTYWRTPIEKGNDISRRDLLSRRLRPFILRRTKEKVAQELPAKTTMIRNVELEGAQRNLYETVRIAMEEKVQAAIDRKGFARSHIIILEALLKLRQVCCDPRLVKLKQVKHIKESAKLKLLFDMLPAMIQEGRKILLFSQFTEMLALIASELKSARFPYVILTGDTTNRVKPIRKFQQGDIPVFLISLKTGGVGLNLTAADTVIHYDPWWNPAVENQATDRAHRIGQDKAVFVYKLIVSGSIEEKIVAMQRRKALLASSILSDTGAGRSGKFSEQDLAALLEPLSTHNALSKVHASHQSIMDIPEFAPPPETKKPQPTSGQLNGS